MLVFATLLATLSSTVRSRAALELENLALRHQIGVLRRSARKRPKLTPVDRLVWAWLSHIWSDWRSALASLLGMEDSAGPAGKTHAGPRSPQPNPQDVPRESHLGCAAHPRRVAQTRHRHRGDQCKQIHGAQPQAAVADLAHLPGKSCPAVGVHRLLYGSHASFPGALRVPGISP